MDLHPVSYQCRVMTRRGGTWYNYYVGKGRQTGTGFYTSMRIQWLPLSDTILTVFFSSAASHDQRGSVTGFILNYNSPIFVI